MVTVPELEIKVRELAAKSPDNIYKPDESRQYNQYVSCFYNEGKCSDGSIGCIIGQAIKALDEEFFEKIKKSVCGVSDIVYGKTKWLQSVQAFQDKGNTWGKCIELSD